MRNALILLLLLVTWAGAKEAPRATLVSTPPPVKSIWTEEESKAYFDPTPTPLESPASGTESTDVVPGHPVMLAMLIAMVILAMFIIGVINYTKREPYPEREPQYENEQIKQINFDDLERPMTNPDRTLVVREKPYIPVAVQFEIDTDFFAST
jgi:hypothetical protein